MLESRNNFVFIENEPIVDIIKGSMPDAEYTFGVPTYGRTEELREALESIYNQKTTISFNVIVSDNNPVRNDDVETMMRELFGDKKNLHYFKNARNIGSTNNWNRLFQQCQTKYMIMLHDDDILFDYYLERMAFIVKRFNDVTAINCEKITWNGIEKIDMIIKPANAVYEHSIWTEFLHYNYNTPSGCLFKTKDLIESGGYNEDDGNSLDYALTMRLLINGKKILKTIEPLMLYRWGNNASTKYEVLHNLLINDYRLKEEVAQEISMNRLAYKFMQYLDVRIRLRSIYKINGIKETFKGMKPAGFFTVAMCKIVRFFIYDIYKTCFCRRVI